MSDILVKSKAVPSNPRSKNYPAGSTVVRGNGGGTTVITGGGSSVDVLKVDDMRSLTDRNVFSSLRTLTEILSRIVKSDADTKLSDENVLSSLRANKELTQAIESLKDLYLSKVNADTAKGNITFDSGATSDLLQSKNYIPGALGAGYIIKRNAETGRSYIEVDEMYVRLKAIFDSLVIKDAQHVSGEQIITNASIECTKVDNVAEFALYDVNGCELYDINGVQLYSSEKRYRCYFTADDGEKAILSQFVAGDFAMCRQFNIKAGVYDGVSNRYYWRYVMEVGDNYIDLSIEDCDAGSDIPQAGDTIIQLGNRTDVSRQNAIIMSSYGENAPLKQMLQGIDSYSLADKVILEEGFDRVTNQGYTKNYGRSYVGDRDKKSYLEYVPGSGLEARCSIKGISDDGNSVYDLRPDGTCFFGKTDPDSGKKTGIIQGVDCFIGGSKRTGIFAVVDDEVVFELDPVTKQYKFIGEVYSDKGKVGGFDIDSYILENKSGQNALIRITNNYRKTTAALGNVIPGIAGFGCGSYFEASDTGDYADNRAVMIRASGSTDEFLGGGKRNICIDAVGGCNWRMAHDDFWSMPGVLFGTRITVSSSGSPSFGISWGNGIDLSLAKISVNTASKVFTFTHGLGHTRYFTFVTPSGQRAAGNNNPCTSSVDNIMDTSFTLSFWGNGNYERVYPLYFDMIIVGVPLNK